MAERLRLRIEQQLQTTSSLSNADYTVLALLSEAPEGRLRVYQLGRTAGWEKSRLHHQLTRMCTRGLVARERTGSRGIEAVITSKGMEALRGALPGHTAEVRRSLIDALSAQQLAQLEQIAGAVLAHLRDIDGEPA